ncbi:MAG: hypothetical protein J6S67_00465 [Methanobrevibacter sp.]|nr:hypothetical protein [Methanobrevibacter sp.]
MTTQRKKYKYYQIMKLVLHDEEVYSWGSLYEKLGVLKWFEERGVKADVRYMFMSAPMQHYINEIFEDKYVTGNYRYKGVPFYARRKIKWDCMNYSPVEIVGQDCLILDITQKTKEEMPKEYKHYMPTFNKD